ncbi:hypothetical protein BDV12DRAFT_195157 [Aspergillus spectabilis]
MAWVANADIVYALGAVQPLTILPGRRNTSDTKKQRFLKPNELLAQGYMEGEKSVDHIRGLFLLPTADIDRNDYSLQVWDNKDMYIYHARVNTELLEELRIPKTAAEYVPWPTTLMRKIPY